MKTPLSMVALALFFAMSAVLGETVADRQGAVLKDRATLENDPRWIYNDYERGFAEGKRTGKPVLVVLRCIPCLACAGIDARVLLNNTELSPLLDQFVCVRVINANALDLSRFQFDFDLSFSTLIFNADGTLYGRYGSWTHQKDPREETTEGFRKSLETALQIHKEYPSSKTSLTGKQPHLSSYKTPVDMPTLQGKYSRNLDWEGTVVQSCVHCHQIGDALRAAYRSKGDRLPSSLVYPFPGPEAMGVSLALDQIARIKTIEPGSPADKAGLRAGDDILSLDGQRLISNADVSWALHNAPDAASVKTVVQRGGQTMNLTLTLPDGWRSHADISRRVGTWSMRAMALGGLLLEDLSEQDRETRGLKKDQLALRAKHVGEYGEHAAAKKAGFRKDDVLVEIESSTARQSESELIGRMLKEHKPGDSIKAVVLRGNERIDLAWPIQ